MIDTEKRGKKFLSSVKRQSIVNQATNDVHSEAQKNYDALFDDHFAQIESEIE